MDLHPIKNCLKNIFPIAGTKGQLWWTNLNLHKFKRSTELIFTFLFEFYQILHEILLVVNQQSMNTKCLRNPDNTNGIQDEWKTA